MGRELNRELASFGELAAVDHQELNVRDSIAVDAFIRFHNPRVIINASAYTNVDRAEGEQKLAIQVNSHAPGFIADLARALNAVFIHISTDYVFDGTLGRTYVETDIPNPLNVYGRSKLAGEQAIQKIGRAYLILRTSWLYSMGGESFVSKVLGWARKNPELRVVDDQVSNPTWVRVLAEMIGRLLLNAQEDPFTFFKKNAGLYHLAGRGYVSRFELAKKILSLASVFEPGLPASIRSARIVDFPAQAQRPLFSALDCTRFETTFGLRLPEWQDALELAMRDNFGGR